MVWESAVKNKRKTERRWGSGRKQKKENGIKEDVAEEIGGHTWMSIVNTVDYYSFCAYS